jgi:hypothetical protein
MHPLGMLAVEYASISHLYITLSDHEDSAKPFWRYCCQRRAKKSPSDLVLIRT